MTLAEKGLFEDLRAQAWANATEAEGPHLTQHVVRTYIERNTDEVRSEYVLRMFPVDEASGLHKNERLSAEWGRVQQKSEKARASIAVRWSDTNVSKRNTIKKKKQKEKKSTLAFGSFYDRYPRRTNRPDAEKAWRQVDGDSRAPAIMVGLERWIESADWADPKFVPYPATWLRGRMWEDQLNGASQGKKSRMVGKCSKCGSAHYLDEACAEG